MFKSHDASLDFFTLKVQLPVEQFISCDSTDEPLYHPAYVFGFGAYWPYFGIGVIHERRPTFFVIIFYTPPRPNLSDFYR